VRVFVCICGARMSVWGCAFVFGSGGGGMCVSGYACGGTENRTVYNVYIGGDSHTSGSQGEPMGEF
jgi:hypothetical protein